MKQKAKLKDWVRDLRDQFPNVIYRSPTVRVELKSLFTGRRRVEWINVDCWADELFRRGYEDLCAEEGFMLAQLVDEPSRRPDILAGWSTGEDHLAMNFDIRQAGAAGTGCPDVAAASSPLHPADPL